MQNKIKIKIKMGTKQIKIKKREKLRY